MGDVVNIRNLKGIALKINDPVKTLIISEPDVMSRDEYLVKIELWLKILDLEKKEGSKND
jgi:hypothetical protein